MNKNNLINGIALGAGLMYLLDPDRGNRRRALIRDQMTHLLRKSEEGTATAVRDLGNRSKGLAAEARSRMRREDVTESVLEARVRSELGRLVSHPGAIRVRAEGERVTLSGPVLAREVEALLSGIASVKGVGEVNNRLEVHQTAADVPGLQGRARRPEPRNELMQENWSPAVRLLMGIVGAGLTMQGMRGRGPLNAALAMAGVGVLSRSATNLEMKRITGLNGGRRAIDIQKTINVSAPVGEVFSFWSNYENFPRFMSHLREVRLTGEGRSHWVAEGPGGVPVMWDAETTAFQENEVIGWKSIGGSPVGNAGIVRFQPDDAGGTRIDIRMSYNPPAGAIGHAVASFFGADPKRAMDEDLVRLQSLLELGKTSAHGQQVSREEIQAR